MRVAAIFFLPALIFSESAFGQTGRLVGLDQGKYVGTYECAQGLSGHMQRARSPPFS